jgi:integrase
LILGSNQPDRQKAELRSAVQTVARLLGAAAAEIPADPGSLQRRLATISPETHGLSRGRWMNVRSLLGKALSLVRPMLPGRSVHPLLPEWAALAAPLPRNRREHIVAMLRDLSVRAIKPCDVTVADLEAYRAAILNDRLRRKPEQTWKNLIWSWNACHREIEGWPDIELATPARPKTYIRSWSDFPPEFRSDVRKYLAYRASHDLSGEKNRRPMRPSTLKIRERQLRVAASALVQRGHNAQSITSLAKLLTIENFREILRFFLDRNDGQKSAQLGHIAVFLKSVAGDWLKVDLETLNRFKTLASNVSMGRIGLTKKNRERLRPFNDDEMVEKFLGLPSAIRKDVERSRRSSRHRAIRAQIAAAIAILQAAPLRSHNLAGLDLERHLIPRGKRLYLVIPAEEVKNSEPIDFELPPETVDMLSWYVRDYRPQLLKGPSTALFPGEGGMSKGASLLSTQISKTVTSYLGVPIHTHLFRHLAGKLYLDVRPGEYEVVRRVLGHRSIATTTSIYSGAETRTAGQHFARVIQERRLANANSAARPRPTSQRGARQ